MKSIKAAGSFLPLVAGAWALSACTPVVTGASSARVADANPITSGPQIGRCRMGGCSWFDIRSFEVVRESSDGALIRLDMRDGGSDHSNGEYPSSARRASINWNDYSNEEYVFCSRRLPALIGRSESGGWEALRIDLLLSMGATEFVTKVYRHVCHPDGDLEAEGAAERLGYRRHQGDDRTFSLSSPEAIFNRIGR